MAEITKGVEMLTQNYVKNPARNPGQIVLTGTVASGATTTYFYMNDACGMATSLGILTDGGTSGVQFTTSGGSSLATFKEYLKSFALVIKSFNFNTTDTNLINNALNAYYITPDGASRPKILFASNFVTNVANNPNLLNVDIPFVMTAQTALKVAMTAPSSGSTVFTYTLKDILAVPYGLLSDVLAALKLNERVADC